jgi:putative Mg2+ transporter-C (MgtC) family protein
MTGLDDVQRQLATWAAGFGDIGEMAFRLLLAAAAGGLVGLEREVRGRQAGFRTNLLVAVGSCLAMIVSLHFATHAWTPQRAGVMVQVDPARIAYGIMTGVGFLGAGTIIHFKGAVRGLTTAAAMWCVSAIGLAAGFGLYLLTGVAVVLVVGALWLLDYVEQAIPKVQYRTVTVRSKWTGGVLEKTVAFFRERGMDVENLTFERTQDLKHVDISLLIGFWRTSEYYGCERELERSPDYEFMATREA